MCLMGLGYCHSGLGWHLAQDLGFLAYIYFVVEAHHLYGQIWWQPAHVCQGLRAFTIMIINLQSLEGDLSRMHH